jgi:hypothetical protein
MMKNIIESIAVFAVFTAILAVSLKVFGSDVKYCRNAETGEIIVIEAGYPCPSPTHEL